MTLLTWPNDARPINSLKQDSANENESVLSLTSSDIPLSTTNSVFDLKINKILSR